MPPKKKGATLKGDEAREFILQYMQEQNKPFNAATLLPNFNGQVGKAEATRILETLAEEEFLSFKDYKKLRFYFYNQDKIEVSDERLAELKKKCKDAEAEGTELQKALGTLEAKVNNMKSAPTDEELEKRLQVLEKENEVLKTKIAAAKESDNSVSAKEGMLVEEKYESAVREWKKRRRICLDILSEISEGSGKKVKVLSSEIGVEYDEDYGVSMDDYQLDTKRNTPSKKRKR